MTEKPKKFILWLKDISKKDILLVGGKNASLGEIYSQLTRKGINIPNGFVLTSLAFWYFLKQNKIDKKLKKIFQGFNPEDLQSLKKTGRNSRKAILRGKFPEDLKREIIKNYRQLSKKYGQKNIDVAARSSATAEDLKTASFAGQHETYLNVKGEKELLKAIKKCMASLFTDRVISYREEKGFNHLTIALSVGIQKMVRSDLASSGVIFTLDTETGFKNVVLINSIFGIGELIVKGKITPDEFYIFKPTLKKGYKPIIVKNLGRKTRKYIYNKTGGLKETAVSQKDQLKFSLTDKEILTLAKWACQIEDHYKFPQDIEWAKDGRLNELFIVQSRPETVHAPKIGKTYKEYKIETKRKPFLTGIGIGNKIGQGRIQVIPSVSRISQFQKGEVLVTRMTDPDWVPIMRIASAIITDEGGKTCFSGDTRVLTNKGFLPIKEIAQSFNEEEIKTLSLNKKTLKLEWKSVINGFKRQAQLAKIEISQTGRMKNNELKTTLDHKFLTFNKRKLVSEEIQKITADNKKIISILKIPVVNSPFNFSSRLGYLLGAIGADGHVAFRKYGRKFVSQIHFIQKPTKIKKAFIEKVKNCFAKQYNYNLTVGKKKPGGGIIKGRRIKGGGAIVLRCSNRKIVRDFLEKQKSLNNILLGADEEFTFNFLAGVIDGDGTYNKESNRINIFCREGNLMRAVILSCLKLGINFQTTRNRGIYNIQLVDKVKEVFKYTARVNGDYKRLKFGTRFFAAKQLLEDIIHKVNYRGRILPYITGNLLIDAEKIRNYIIPLIKGQPENHSLTRIIDSSLKMLRARQRDSLGINDVYNIEVKDNHNYIVFTNRYTPILVENCHAAIVSRELGIPTIVGTKKATRLLKTNQEVTVDCTSGRIFLGKIPFKIKKYNLGKIPKLPVKIVLNLGAPEAAFKHSFLPADGVGLAREEFIIAEKIRIHPLALYHYRKIKNKKIKSEIDKLTVGYKDKKKYFIDKLAEGISQIAAAFYPKEVIVRLSDFKTNEYAALIGGEGFEPKEANPMLGWRGASRYYDKKFRPAFEMECQAIKKARDVFGLKNIWVMVPFCRTVQEGKKVLDLMAKNGLKKSRDNLKVIVMCEIPSNVILAKEFLEIFDGMSIGSNDLTQLTLGIDRDSANIAHIGDERNEAVKKLIVEVIKECRKRKKYVGICGEAASMPDFARFLINHKIEALSVNPDSVIPTILAISKKRKRSKK